MELTNKERQQLTLILSDFNKAANYLKKDTTLVCSSQMPHNLSYYNKEGQGITPMSKFVGNELNYLLNGIEKLNHLLYPTPINITTEL